MVQEWINLLPRDPGNAGLIIAVIGSLIGAAVWLLGSRFSRPILTLITVLLGAAIGMHLPVWFNWNVMGAGPAVGGALVLGISGYALPGMWVGIGFGTVLASWAAVGTWIALHNGADWNWPAIDANTTIVSYAAALWHALPPDVAKYLPWCCGAAMVSGVAMSIIWPKVALLVGWSMAGATLLVGMGVAAVNFGRPQWLANLPTPMWAQTSLLAMVVTLGALIQWKLGPKPAGAKVAKKKPKDEDHDD